MSLEIVMRAAAYAAEMHRDQRRKGAGGAPYVNHVLDVAHRVSQGSAPPDPVLVAAALLHDVIEDTDATAQDLAARFGPEVTALVLEVTDDKALPKAERKRLQVVRTLGKSDRAKRLKLADLASNVASLPDAWETARRRDYLDWAAEVAVGCQGADPALEAALDAALAEAAKQLGETA